MIQKHTLVDPGQQRQIQDAPQEAILSPTLRPRTEGTRNDGKNKTETARQEARESKETAHQTAEGCEKMTFSPPPTSTQFRKRNTVLVRLE